MPATVDTARGLRPASCRSLHLNRMPEVRL